MYKIHLATPNRKAHVCGYVFVRAKFLFHLIWTCSTRFRFLRSMSTWLLNFAKTLAGGKFFYPVAMAYSSSPLPHGQLWTQFLPQKHIWVSSGGVRIVSCTSLSQASHTADHLLSWHISDDYCLSLLCERSFTNLTHIHLPENILSLMILFNCCFAVHELHVLHQGLHATHPAAYANGTHKNHHTQWHVFLLICVIFNWLQFQQA